MDSLDFLAAHMVGDYVLQTNEEAIRKTEELKPLLTHVAKYMAAFVPVVLSSNASWKRRTLFIVFTAYLHFATDRRRWASGKAWSPKPILVDQALHAIQLALLRRLL